VAAYSPYYCPYPVLVDKSNQKIINEDLKKIKEVYAVYKEWFKRSKKTGFKKFDLPLRNSHYEWYDPDTARVFNFL